MVLRRHLRAASCYNKKLFNSPIWLGRSLDMTLGRMSCVSGISGGFWPMSNRCSLLSGAAGRSPFLSHPARGSSLLCLCPADLFLTAAIFHTLLLSPMFLLLALLLKTLLL